MNEPVPLKVVHSKSNRDQHWLERYPALKAYLARVASAVEHEYRLVHFMKAVFEEPAGRYRRPIATVQWDRKGVVTFSEAAYAPDDAEAETIKAEITAAPLPVSVPVASLELAPFRDDDPELIFKFLNEKGEIIFVQQRTADADAKYLPWSYWSDGLWRVMEPRTEADKGLPLWGLDQLRENAVVWLHEGAKAARFCRMMAEGSTFEERQRRDAHPWGNEIEGVAHLGWVGGAYGMSRVDWTPLLKRPDIEIVLICDNDDPGNEAATWIAWHLPHKMAAIRFDQEFPSGFDLADDFPAELFKEINGKRHYIGPGFFDCLVPTTWATEPVPTAGKGRPAFRIRNEFARQWCWSIEGPIFFQTDNPAHGYTERQFNDKIRPFSDVDDTARLLKKSAARQVEKETYEPARKPGIIVVESERQFNSFKPSKVKPRKGDVGPWLDFLEHLIPDEEDREQLMRWCATLIVRRDIRMVYGVLLTSAKQGVGKTTLAEKVLAPLLGRWNVSAPPQKELEGNFNSYLARVLLVVVREIYAGQSKKLYDDLKDQMTEPDARVNEKFRPAVTMPNWAAFLAMSNATNNALWMSDKDRRWFVPTVTEQLKPKQYWIDFNEWLRADGLGIIRRWADEFVAEHGVVGAGDHAPDSAKKRRIIADMMPEDRRLVRDLGNMMMRKTRLLEYQMWLALMNVNETAMKNDEPLFLPEAPPAKASPPVGYVVVLKDVEKWLDRQLTEQERQKKTNRSRMIRDELLNAGLYARPTEEKRFEIKGRSLVALATFEIGPKTTWPDIEARRQNDSDLEGFLGEF